MATPLRTNFSHLAAYDEQLRRAGWEADSSAITYGRGSRPEKGRNVAIAEWPTATGPADYVLFAGLVPLATVEAKRKHTDVSGALQQAKRYSRGLSLTEGCPSPGGPWGEYIVPFVFSANGRPYLRQLATRSGIWFCDLRRPENLSHALDGWYTPEGLMALLIFTYSYREAVIDGYLVDHEPPVQIRTLLSEDGIRWGIGEEVKVYDVRRAEVQLFTTPDEIKIEAFNEALWPAPAA
jgi:type I site-specific restriction endonuclease